MIKWETVWDSLGIIFVPLPIRKIQDHFAIQPIQRFDGNIAIATYAIQQKVEVNVCDGMQIIITSKIAWAANLFIGIIRVYC